jgi:uncharacterized protein YbcC (UPF0753/DUF2309 family)
MPSQSLTHWNERASLALDCGTCSGLALDVDAVVLAHIKVVAGQQAGW